MRLATVTFDGSDRVVAAIDDNTLLDLAAAAKMSGKAGVGFVSMQALIEGGPAALDEARALAGDPPDEALLRVADVSFRAPLPRPVRMRDCLVFEEHLRNSSARAAKMTGSPERSIPEVWFQQPIYYKCNHLSVIGHGQDTIWPAYSELMDFELELAIVIGRTGKDIPVATAMDHVFGYTIYNDMSARDAQVKEMAGQLGPAKGKDFDTGNILGPYILTADEVEHPASLDMEVRINGERWGGGNSGSMQYSFADIVSFLSRSETLYAGEVIGSGTVGTGCGFEVGKWLKPGDLIELTIEKIGTLSNRIVRPQ
jgi:2-keto-4-pentenoate hydratase/2-oxohepta-3-ene-1,7-dioic acid hydratase in catechol pathway